MPTITVRYKIVDGQVYFNANDLALEIDSRGDAAEKADFGGFNGRIIKNTFNAISRFIREMEVESRGR